MILLSCPIDGIPLLAGNAGFQERSWMKGEAKINANEFSSPWTRGTVFEVNRLIPLNKGNGIRNFL